MYNYHLRVRNLLKKYGTADPMVIAKALKIKVFAADLPSHVNGMWKRVLRRKYICYNQNLEDWQIKAVVAHELGHILLHPAYKHYCTENRTYFASTKHENEADTFALYLLKEALVDIDQEDIKKFLKEGWK